MAPAVEKPPAIVEGLPPFGLRYVEWLLMVEARPGVEIDGRNAIGGDARPLFDGVRCPNCPNCPGCPKRPNCPGCPAVPQVSRWDTPKGCPVGTAQRVSRRLIWNCPIGTVLRDSPLGQRLALEREREHAHCPPSLSRRPTSDLLRPVRSAMARTLSPPAFKAAKASSLSSATMAAVVHWP